MDSASSPPRGIGSLVRFAFLMLALGSLIGILGSFLQTETAEPDWFDTDATAPPPVEKRSENRPWYRF